MQDELDMLKRDWQKQEAHLPKLSYDEIYKMIWKRSSSVVKWIFYISVLEFAFWTALNLLFTDQESWDTFRELHLYEFTIVLTTLSYVVLLFFIFKFYVNYRRISVTDSSRGLMKAILTVRKTVTQYVWFNISLFAISLVASIYATLRYGEDSLALAEAASKAGNQPLFWLIIVGVSFAFVAVLLLLLWLFYRLLYGLLLKRLKKNYDELRQMEV